MTDYENIYGYPEIKEELNLIHSWLNNKQLRDDPRVTLPRGIIFYGNPGCGKSLFVKAFVDKLNVPTYYISNAPQNGEDGKNSSEVSIQQAFAASAKNDFSLIVIDELDMFTENSFHRRLLQTKMDGVTKDGKIFFLATTNHIDDIPSAFLRPGRFDKQIFVSEPDKASRIELFKKYLARLDIHISDDDISHIANYVTGVSCADIMAICNDAYLRCGERATSDDVELSYDRVSNRSFVNAKSPFAGDYRIAVHEAGHAIMTLRFSKDFRLYKVSYVGNGGLTETYPANEYDDCIRKRTEQIQIGLAGYIAEEVILGYHDLGSVSDVDKVYNLINKLISRTCVKSINDYIPAFRGNDERYETPEKRAHLERRVERTLAKYIRKTRKFIRAHSKEVLDLAQLLVQKGQVTPKDLAKVNINTGAGVPVGAIVASYARSVEGSSN